MKLKTAGEPRPQQLRSRDALDSTPEPLPYETVLAMMREYKPTMVSVLELHQNKITFFSFGRALLDVYPELKDEYAPKEDTWEAYKEHIKVLNLSAGNREKFSGAVALFPKHRNEIKYEGRRALDNFGRDVSVSWGMGVNEFQICLMLSWVREESNFRWKELMEGSWDECMQEIPKETNLPPKLNGAADMVLYRPSARAEIQQIIIPVLPAVQQYLQDRHAHGSDHELPLVLRALKIIFSKSVTADEFGRLTFEEGKRSAVSTAVPLPARDLTS